MGAMLVFRMRGGRSIAPMGRSYRSKGVGDHVVSA
jgi:hypothetical protein